jgi:hypothetical protein
MILLILYWNILQAMGVPTLLFEAGHFGVIIKGK